MRGRCGELENRCYRIFVPLRHAALNNKLQRGPSVTGGDGRARASRFSQTGLIVELYLEMASGGHAGRAV